MKKTVLFLMAAMISVAMISCGGKKEEAKDEKKSEVKYDANSPEGVVVAYLKAGANYDFEKQKELVLEKSIPVVELGEDMAKTFLDGKDVESYKKDIEVEGLKCTVTGDKAICTHETVFGTDTLNLVKEDGKWLIDLGSMDFFSMDSSMTTGTESGM